ncbi:putative membrane chloride channel (bestrophin family) [Bradyrhizobium sp. LA8.1]|uniref:hypothetical protein n=1 Tax=unclassified Bradyrhizobium TaxID=2631580 RepID=UPI00339957D3
MPKADFLIDDASYQEGRAAFTAGATIRSIAEQVQTSVVAGTFDDDKVLSSAIGFADALLDHLRGKCT